MGKCKFGNKASKGNISVLATTLVFLVLGIVFLVISYHNQVLPWLKTTGIALLVIAVPILLWVLHNVIIKKIKDM